MPRDDWGGRRKGAGHPPIYEQPLIQKTVRLSEEQIEAMSAIAGSLSEAIRRVLDEWIERCKSSSDTEVF
jgi:hypothetical protein